MHEICAYFGCGQVGRSYTYTAIWPLENVIKSLQITTSHRINKVARAWTDRRTDRHTDRQTTVTFSHMRRGLIIVLCKNTTIINCTHKMCTLLLTMQHHVIRNPKYPCFYLRVCQPTLRLEVRPRS